MQDNTTHTNLKTKLHAAKTTMAAWPRKRQIATGCASAAVALCLIGGGTALALNMPQPSTNASQTEQNAQKSADAKTAKKTTDSKAAGDEKTKASDLIPLKQMPRVQMQPQHPQMQMPRKQRPTHPKTPPQVVLVATTTAMVVPAAPPSRHQHPNRLHTCIVFPSHK